MNQFNKYISQVSINKHIGDYYVLCLCLFENKGSNTLLHW